jgi:predicted metal-dependent peptidase
MQRRVIIDGEVKRGPFAKAKVQFMLKHPFFATLVGHLPTVPKPPEWFAMIGAPATACVDGKKIYYNEEWVLTLTPPQRMGLLAHECMHPALQHLWRRGNRDRNLWLLAADYVVNSVLLNTINEDGSRAFELPPDGLYDSRFDGMSAEQIYSILKEEQEEEQGDGDEGDEEGEGGCCDHRPKPPGGRKGRVLDGQFDKPLEEDEDDDEPEQKSKSKGKSKGKSQDESDDDGQGSGSDEGDDESDESDGDDGAGEGQGDDDADGEGSGEGGGDESDSDADGESQGSGSGSGQGEGGEGQDDYDNTETDDEPIIEEDLEEHWRSLINQAVMNAKARGNMPGDLERLVEEITEPQMPWQAIVDQFVTMVSRDDYNMLQPDRRHYGDGYYFPDLHSDALTVGVFTDSSGSITERENAAFAGEIFGLLSSRGMKAMRLIVCDARITKDVVLTPYDDVPTDFPGGGGTDFRPPFRRLQEEPGEMPRPSLLVYLTDMCGPFPEEDPGIPTIWLASVPTYMNFEDLPKPNFGTVIKYQPVLDD